jgi:hypothetical protein
VSTELETQSEAQLEQLRDAEKQLADAKAEAMKDEPIQLPRLGLIGGLTKGKRTLKKADGTQAEDGLFYNNVTGEVFGESVEFLVVEYYRGRFYSDKILGSFRATGPVVPDHWPEKFRGKAFVDLPESEEGFNRLIDSGELKEWGHGPPISTTYNFVGFVLDPAPVTDFPMELSLMRANVPAARALRRLLTPMRNYHDRPVQLSTSTKDAPGKTGGEYHVVEAGRFGEPTSPENRARAVDLWLKLQKAGFSSVGPETEAPEQKPAATAASDEEDPSKPDF